MKYKIGELVLDTTARTISDPHNSNPIRPKTLELLLYLANRKGEIISKEELLEQLWSDVKVDEGVVFQSITEIRKLFSEPKVILNYPRRGYEFTEALIPLHSNKAPIRLNNFIGYKASLYAAFITFILVLFLYVNFPQRFPNYQHQIVVLPVKNHVNYAKDNWQGMGGMAKVIASLKSNNAVYIYQSDEIPTLMHQAGLGMNYTDEDINKIFKVSGATLIVETDVYGGINNYNLVYKFHVNNDVKQGSIFDTSIDGALVNLSEIISEFTSQPISYGRASPAKEFNEALFAQAIVSYESDWKSSVSFFESYLTLDAESIIARLYLSRLYLWQGRIDDANAVIDFADSLPTNDVRLTAYIKFIQGQSSAKQEKWQEATSLYTNALKILKTHSDWSLKGDILSHHAETFELSGKLNKAYSTYIKALSYYEIIDSPIGINSSRIHLARVLHRLGKPAEAKLYFALAQQEIKSNKLSFIYTLLEQNQANISFD